MTTQLALEGCQRGFCVTFLHAVRDHVITHGGDANVVMESVGCSSRAFLGRSSERVTARQLSAALNAAARVLKDEHVGLRIGVKPSQMGAFGFAAMTAADGIGALALYAELQGLCMTEVVTTHEIQGALVRIISERSGSLPNDYPFWSFLLNCQLTFIRVSCGWHVVPDRVALPCPAPRCDQALSELVGAPVVFNSIVYSKWFAVRSLREPNPHSSPEIHQVMAMMARRKWRESFDPDALLISKLKGAILHALEQGRSPTLQSLSARLAQPEGAASVVSVRQLQRRLGALRQSFRDLVSEVRRERAIGQLRSTDRPLADIAADAGYAELSSFHRAVRRWTGLTPMRIRKEGENCMERQLLDAEP